LMRKHHDHIHSIFDGQRRGIPVLSFVGNLNEDYEGGELAFFDGETKFALKSGDICMFPSCFLYPHEVLEVTKGQRFSFALWAW
jgi:predicted 2-oxoglutarate/Fe(II)-dependent dioxygenase YbiX